MRPWVSLSFGERATKLGIGRPSALVLYNGAADGAQAKKAASFAQDNRKQGLDEGVDSAQTLINDAIDAKVKVTPKFIPVILGIMNAFLNIIASQSLFVFSPETGTSMYVREYLPVRHGS